MAELAHALRQLRERDKRFRVFGSSSHKYISGPKLREAHLKKFEQEHCIRLPEDLRLFLQRIGNGGAGPFYGLEPLDKAAQYGDLSKPFPFTQATDFYADDTTEIDARDEHPGALLLCEEGCASYNYLIVNGPAYGTVWTADEDFYPTGLSFTLWYRRWLERVSRVLANDSLAQRLRLGMTKEQIATEIECQWYEIPSLLEPKSVLGCRDLPFRLELNQAGTLTRIVPLLFIE